MCVCVCALADALLGVNGLGNMKRVSNNALSEHRPFVEMAYQGLSGLCCQNMP